jgi:hypothetical protein
MTSCANAEISSMSWLRFVELANTLVVAIINGNNTLVCLVVERWYEPFFFFLWSGDFS